MSMLPFVVAVLLKSGDKPRVFEYAGKQAATRRVASLVRKHRLDRVRDVIEHTQSFFVDASTSTVPQFG